MPSKLSIEVEAFKPMRSNTLVGFCTVLIPEMHLKIVDCTVHEKNDSRWCGLPAKPIVGRDGQVKRDERGKIAYVPILEFPDRETRDAFSTRVIEALLTHSPAAFDETAA